MMRFMCGLMLLLGAGCVHFGESPPAPTNTTAPLAALGKNITPDQVTAQNAHAVVDELWDRWALDTQEKAVPSKKVN